MALSVVNNNASLNAQQNLSRTSGSLSKSLERLSSGLKINRGADGPAALVISEQQRANISGLRTALDNTNKAVSLVQTGEGALQEINSLLGKARSLALDSAQAGVNDTAALAANQSEITSLLETINKIANTTQFNNQLLFADTEEQSKTLISPIGANADQVASPIAKGSERTLTFQIGPNTNQTVSLTLKAVNTNALGVDANAQVANLSAIDVSTSGSAQDAVQVIDKAISDVSSLRSTLGAFQANTLESNANNLRASLENTVAAESVIRDTDFATEIANFTRAQVQLQAGSTVLGNANQIPQLVASLLRG
ncbi:MAG: flagellin [Blastocatellia bacterium]|nr:flagellin [Blastocatellia bacterium]